MVDPLSFDASTTKAPSPLYVLEEDDTPTSINFSVFFGTQISTFSNPNIFI